MFNMKTIAISIDEPTLQAVDRLAKGSALPAGNRSRIIRAAVQEYVQRESQRRREAIEGDIFKKHSRRLARQARALISEQAEP
jgi:metal-responsive CopG/Arc/MetJ family transcriptional regulator